MASNMGPFGKPLRPKPRRRGGMLAAPGMGLLLAIGLIAVLGSLSADASTPAPTSSSRPIAEPAVLPGYRHTLAVLVGGGPRGSPAWSAAEMKAAASKVVEPVEVVWYKGAEAVGLGGFFGAEQLPAVVYLKPHCLPQTCGAPPVLQLRAAAAGADGGSQGPTSAAAVADWITRTGRQAILLANDHPNATMRYRHVRDPLHPDARPPLGSFDLPPRGRQWIETPFRADWVVSPAQAKGSSESPPILARLKVKGDTQLVVRNPDECNLFADDHCELPMPHHVFSPEIAKVRQGNADRKNADIKHQKATIPRFTPVGYEKRRAPQLLYAMLKEYFDSHKNSTVVEHWTEDNVYVNHESSRFLVVDLPEVGSMKPTMFELVRPIFEEWAPGSAPLVASAIYGIRVYTSGSSLVDHADRPDSHIISAIINVDQDVEEPWPLEIFGHSGQPSQVLMKPGDMVLYEGASCAHGRPSLLKGRFMANVFLHMRPRDKHPPFNGQQQDTSER